MYELLLCGLDEQLGLEAEYFWNRKWRVSKIPDPKNYGWEQDLERDRIFQALAIVLVDSFNYRVVSGDSNRKTDMVPKWARSLLEAIDEPDELHQYYPGLGKLYFYFPWRHLSFIHPPCSPQVIGKNLTHFWNVYKYHQKTMSLPLFTAKDTPLSSLCRIYELSVLVNHFPEVKDTYERELIYFFEKSSWQGISAQSLLDPRGRWERMDKREPQVYPELIRIVSYLTNDKLAYSRRVILPH
jgi:hypothetical protein